MLLHHLPHLDTLDREASLLGILRPVIPPPRLGIPKVRHGRKGSVKPRFLTFTIREPTVSGTDSEV